MSHYNFVKLQQADAVAIQKVMSLAFKTAYFSASDNQEEQEYIKNLINSDNTSFYGLRDKDELIAATYCLPLSNGVYELARIMVLPSYQKNKIGSFLLSETIKKLKEKFNASILFLECQKDIMTFYKRNGFCEITENDDLYLESAFQQKQNSLKMFINEESLGTSSTRIMGRRI